MVGDYKTGNYVSQNYFATFAINKQIFSVILLGRICNLYSDYFPPTRI